MSDNLVGDCMRDLTLEFVTFEASQDVHTYSSIQFEFPVDGSV